MRRFTTSERPNLSRFAGMTSSSSGTWMAKVSLALHFWQPGHCLHFEKCKVHQIPTLHQKLQVKQLESAAPGIFPATWWRKPQVLHRHQVWAFLVGNPRRLFWIRCVDFGEFQWIPCVFGGPTWEDFPRSQCPNFPVDFLWEKLVCVSARSSFILIWRTNVFPLHTILRKRANRRKKNNTFGSRFWCASTSVFGALVFILPENYSSHCARMNCHTKNIVRSML